MGRNDSQGRHSGHKKGYGRIMPDRFALAQSPLYGLYPCPGGGIRTASNSACLGLVVPRMTRICRRPWQFDPKMPCHRLHHGLVHSKQLPGFLAPKPSGSIAAQPSAWVAKFPARTANCSTSQPVLSCGGDPTSLSSTGASWSEVVRIKKTALAAKLQRNTFSLVRYSSSIGKALDRGIEEDPAFSQEVQLCFVTLHFVGVVGDVSIVSASIICLSAFMPCLLARRYWVGAH